jgi:spore cortex formation protein SpoVR/YcgB (stage V sporulation)
MIQTKNNETISHILWGDNTTNKVDVVINGVVTKIKIDDIHSELGKSHVEKMIDDVNALRRTILESLGKISAAIPSDDSKKVLEMFKTGIENCNYAFVTDTATIKKELSPVYTQITASNDTQLRIEFSIMVDLFLKYCVN